MNKYDIVLLDLDGTISESGEGILSCVKIAFEQLKKPLPDDKTLASFIGPPLQYSFGKCGFSEEEIAAAVNIYKKNFVETGIYRNKTYDGIPELLAALQANGVRLAVATTKYAPFAEKIIGMLQIGQYLELTAGATADDTRRTKAAVIRYALEKMGADRLSRVVMTGDTAFDAEGAAAVGINFIGCLYGYGSREEMEAYCPTAPFVSCPSEIMHLVIQ